MKRFYFTLIALFSISLVFELYSQEAFNQADSARIKIENIEKSLNYQTGTIEFNSCNAKLKVPDGFRFLDSNQSRYVLSDLWGNPVDSTVLGLLVPINRGILEPNSWVFTISFEEIGYVKDDDAEEINYEELLTNLQKETKESNAERVKLGYEPIEIIGWASKPFYDKDKKVLHWAKEAKFGQDSVNVLNYNLRVLGRKGVFVLNAVASMSELNDVKPNIDKVLASIEFDQGSSYFDFDPKIDNVAAWTIGGLVAGKILAKVGFIAIIAKFGKLIALGLIAAGTAAWKFIRGRRKKQTEYNKQIESKNELENE